MVKIFLSWFPLASASCLITSKVCANFPEFGRTQFRDVVGEEYLQAAQHEAACLKRAEDFHHWCGNTGNISVAATFMPDKTQFYDPGACDAGWSQWQAFCYRFHLDLKTWREAEEICLAQESHLASVHSMEENRFVHLLAHGLKVWIGYHQQQERFAWTDRSQEDFTNFAKNCSGRSHEADCQADQVQQQWHHSSGAERSPFVCKRNAKRVSAVHSISAERLLKEEWELLRLGLHDLPSRSWDQKLLALKALLPDAKNQSGVDFQALLPDAKNQSGVDFQALLPDAKNQSGVDFQELSNSSATETLITWMQDLPGCSSSVLETPRIYHHALTATW